jgi:hypothetical protein
MSFLITAKVPGDVDQFQKALADRPDEFLAVVDKAQAAGAIHHRFGLGDGFVLVVDEWESPAAFEAFFTEPAMQEFIASMGGDTSVPPEITVTTALTTVDQF